MSEFFLESLDFQVSKFSSEDKVTSTPIFPGRHSFEGEFPSLFEIELQFPISPYKQQTFISSINFQVITVFSNSEKIANDLEVNVFHSDNKSNKEEVNVKFDVDTFQHRIVCKNQLEVTLPLNVFAQNIRLVISWPSKVSNNSPIIISEENIIQTKRKKRKSIENIIETHDVTEIHLGAVGINSTSKSSSIRSESKIQILLDKKLQRKLIKRLSGANCANRYENLHTLNFIVNNIPLSKISILKQFDFVSFIHFNILETSLVTIIHFASNILIKILQSKNLVTQFFSQIHLIFPQLSQTRTAHALFQINRILLQIKGQMDDSVVQQLYVYVKEKLTEFEKNKSALYNKIPDGCSDEFIVDPKNYFFTAAPLLYYYRTTFHYTSDTRSYYVDVKANHPKNAKFYQLSIPNPVNCYFELHFWSPHSGETDPPYFLFSTILKTDVKFEYYFKCEISRLRIYLYSDVQVDRLIEFYLIEPSTTPINEEEKERKEYKSLINQLTDRPSGLPIEEYKNIVNHNFLSDYYKNLKELSAYQQNTLFSDNEDSNTEEKPLVNSYNTSLSEAILYYFTTFLSEKDKAKRIIIDEQDYYNFVSTLQNIHLIKLKESLRAFVNSIYDTVESPILKNLMNSSYQSLNNPNFLFSHKDWISSICIFAGNQKVLPDVFLSLKTFTSNPPYDFQYLFCILSFLLEFSESLRVEFNENKKINKYNIKILLKVLEISNSAPIFKTVLKVLYQFARYYSLDYLEEHLFSSKYFNELLKSLLNSEYNQSYFYKFMYKLLSPLSITTSQSYSAKYLIQNKIFTFIEKNLNEIKRAEGVAFYLSLLSVFNSTQIGLTSITSPKLISEESPRIILNAKAKKKVSFAPNTNSDSDDYSKNNVPFNIIEEPSDVKGDDEPLQIILQKINKLDQRICGFVIESIAPIFPLEVWDNILLWNQIITLLMSIELLTSMESIMAVVTHIIRQSYKSNHEQLFRSFGKLLEHIILYSDKDCLKLLISNIIALIDSSDCVSDNSTFYLKTVDRIGNHLSQQIIKGGITLAQGKIIQFVVKLQKVMFETGSNNQINSIVFLFVNLIPHSTLFSMKAEMKEYEEEFWNLLLDILDKHVIVDSKVTRDLTRYLTSYIQLDSLYFLELITRRISANNNQQLTMTIHFFEVLLKKNDLSEHFLDKLNGLNVFFSMLYARYDKGLLLSLKNQGEKRSVIKRATSIAHCCVNTTITPSIVHSVDKIFEVEFTYPVYLEEIQWSVYCPLPAAITLFPNKEGSDAYYYHSKHDSLQQIATVWKKSNPIRPIRKVLFEFPTHTTRMSISYLSFKTSNTSPFEKSIHDVSITDILYSITQSNPILLKIISSRLTNEQEEMLTFLLCESLTLNQNYIDLITSIAKQKISFAQRVASALFKHSSINYWHSHLLANLAKIDESIIQQFYYACFVPPSTKFIQSILHHLFKYSNLPSLSLDHVLNVINYLFTEEGSLNVDGVIPFLNLQIKLQPDYYQSIYKHLITEEEEEKINASDFANEVLRKKLSLLFQLCRDGECFKTLYENGIIGKLVEVDYPKVDELLSCVAHTKEAQEWSKENLIHRLLTKSSFELIGEFANNHFEIKEMVADIVFGILETEFKQFKEKGTTSSLISSFSKVKSLMAIQDQYSVSLSQCTKSVQIPNIFSQNFSTSSASYLNNQLTFTNIGDTISFPQPLPYPISFTIYLHHEHRYDKTFQFSFLSKDSKKYFQLSNTYATADTTQQAISLYTKVMFSINEKGKLFTLLRYNYGSYMILFDVDLPPNIHFHITQRNLKGEKMTIKQSPVIVDKETYSNYSAQIDSWFLKNEIESKKPSYLGYNSILVKADIQLHTLIGSKINYPPAGQTVAFSIPTLREELPISMTIKELIDISPNNNNNDNNREGDVVLNYTYRPLLPNEGSIFQQIDKLPSTLDKRLKFDSIFEIFVRKNGLNLLATIFTDLIKYLFVEVHSKNFFNLLEYSYHLSRYAAIPGFKLKFTNSPVAVGNLALLINYFLDCKMEMSLLPKAATTVVRSYSESQEKLLPSINQCLSLLLSQPSTVKQIKLTRREAFESGAIQAIILNILHQEKLKCGEMLNDDLLRERQILQQFIIDTQRKEYKQSKKGKSYWSKGTGYGTHNDIHTNFNHQAFMKEQLRKSIELSKSFQILSSYLSLPPINGKKSKVKSIEKYIPIEKLYTVLERSGLFSVIHSYLRNDSLLDLLNFTELYKSLFTFIESISFIPSLFPLLTTPTESSLTTFDLIQSLNKMASLSLKSISENVEQVNVFVSRLNSVFTTLEQKSKLSPSNSSTDLLNGKGNNINNNNNSRKKKREKRLNTKERLHRKYMDMKDLQFDETEGIVSTPSYHYKSQLNHGVLPNNTMQRLIGEMSSLSSNLPLHWSSSVFLRVDSSHMNVIQAMITGPQKTPYQNGCFLFDIYCGTTFPNQPPMVNLQTTGNRTFRFNPNLYNCGKVCLSLLGTWQGAENEKWNEQTSTLLQVFVSIQALIFVEQPYFNEPSYEQNINNPIGWAESKLYNDNIKPATIQFAMTDMILKPPKGFEEVVKTHFTLKKQEILKQVAKWEKDQLSKKKRLKTAVVALKAALLTLPSPLDDDQKK